MTSASPFAYITPHEKKTKGSFEGIVTLRTPEESKELVLLVDTIIHKAVDVFYRMEKDAGAIADLMRDVRRMNELCATFPPLCSDDEGRNAAQARCLCVTLFPDQPHAGNRASDGARRG